jgi:hypothetical protein
VERAQTRDDREEIQGTQGCHGLLHLHCQVVYAQCLEQCSEGELPTEARRRHPIPNCVVTLIGRRCLETRLGGCHMHPHFLNNHPWRQIVEGDKCRIQQKDPDKSPSRRVNLQSLCVRFSWQYLINSSLATNSFQSNSSLCFAL